MTSDSDMNRAINNKSKLGEERGKMPKKVHFKRVEPRSCSTRKRMREKQEIDEIMDALDIDDVLASISTDAS